MANQHPITPPPELVQQWLGTYFGTTVTGEVSDVELVLATQAARWSADQELEACCEWLKKEIGPVHSCDLRAARRPKPPSLKEQAIKALEPIERYASAPVTTNKESLALIRKALEALPND